MHPVFVIWKTHECLIKTAQLKLKSNRLFLNQLLAFELEDNRSQFSCMFTHKRQLSLMTVKTY